MGTILQEFQLEVNTVWQKQADHYELYLVLNLL